MTAPQTAMIRFFYSPTTIGPSFVIPVYEAGGLYIASGRSDGLIEGFEEWKLADLVSRNQLDMVRRPPHSGAILYRHANWLPILTATEFGESIVPVFENSFVVVPLGSRNHEGLLNCSVGEPMRLAYATNTAVFLGGSSELKEELRKQKGTGFWQNTPFCEIEVAEFIGDQEQYQDSVHRASDVMRKDNEMIADRWRRFMLGAVGNGMMNHSSNDMRAKE